MTQTMRIKMLRCLWGLAVALVCVLDSVAAHATSTATISSNVNGMRQLSGSNVVQQYPGAAPYYGPSICQQQLSNFQAQMGAGYSCACPQGAQTPVCTPVCSTLLPSYQQSAGPTYSCACPVADQVPVCTPIPCSGLLNYYQGLHPGDTCTCPAGASLPQCVAPPPTCSQLLASYQQQYQAQQGAGVPVTCSCPNPNATSNPVCTCGSQYTGFWLFNFVNDASSEYGMGMMFVDTYGNVTFEGFTNLWTGAFVGTGSVSSAGNLVGGRTTTVGAQGAWTGFYTQATASGSYTLDWVNSAASPGCASNPSGCGSWTATKFSTFSTGCAAGTPPCGQVLSVSQSVFGGQGATCQCFAGTSSNAIPGCYYQACTAAESIQTGSWTFTVYNNGAYDTTCYGSVSAQSDTVGSTPDIRIQATCSSGDAFGLGQTPYQNSTNGDVSCTSTLGQNVPGYVGTQYSSTPVDGGLYWMSGTFTSATSFTGTIIQNPALTIRGSYN